MNRLSIRPEMPADGPAIAALIKSAFHGHPHSDGHEADILAALRGNSDLTLSLVCADEAIIGHIAFSPVAIGDGSTGWYGLAPLSVAPSRQMRGIGAALVERGLCELKAIGAQGCVVLGDPEYYGRFGFAADCALAYPGAPAGMFQALLFAGAAPRGTVQYASAFG